MKFIILIWIMKRCIYLKCYIKSNHEMYYQMNPLLYVGCFSSSLPHDDVIKWKHFPRYWPFVRGIHRFPVNYPHKGQWRGDLMFSLICARINGWVNNGEAGDLRRHHAHFDVIVVLNSMAVVSYSLEVRAWLSNDIYNLMWMYLLINIMN